LNVSEFEALGAEAIGLANHVVHRVNIKPVDPFSPSLSMMRVIHDRRKAESSVLVRIMASFRGIMD
jgi:hypothetical protein